MWYSIDHSHLSMSTIFYKMAPPRRHFFEATILTSTLEALFLPYSDSFLRSELAFLSLCLEQRNKLREEYAVIGDKTFFLDYIKCNWYGSYHRNSGSTDRCIYYWRRILPGERAVPDRVVLEIPFNSEVRVLYRQVFPFRFDLDECSSWAKWETCPIEADFKFQALTLIDPTLDPRGPQPRGIANHLETFATHRLLTEFITEILTENGSCGPDSFTTSFGLSQRLFSLTGFTELIPPPLEDLSFLDESFP